MYDIMFCKPAKLSSLVVIDLVNNDQQCHDIVKGILYLYCQNRMLIDKYIWCKQAIILQLSDLSYNLDVVKSSIPIELSSFIVIDIVNNVQQYYEMVKGVLETCG